MKAKKECSNKERLNLVNDPKLELINLYSSEYLFFSEISPFTLEGHDLLCVLLE